LVIGQWINAGVFPVVDKEASNYVAVSWLDEKITSQLATAIRG
jgi:hypothetical protein